MHVYDTLIIGSGYFSVGYAIKNKNTVICEEHQLCDVNFYLPLNDFTYHPYTPTTTWGEKLFNFYSERNLFCNNMQNLNSFEGAFCKFIYENEVNVLLKTRVIKATKTADGIYDVTVQSNEGLTHIFTKNIIDTVNKSPKTHYTVLFFSENIKKDSQLLLNAFSGAKIVTAFYNERYAIQIPTFNQSENLVKLYVYEKWKNLATSTKIIYMAPVLYSLTASSNLCDNYYNNPIQAFEAGYLYKGEKL